MKRVSRLIVTHPRGISIRNPTFCAWPPIKLPHHYGKRHYFPRNRHTGTSHGCAACINRYSQIVCRSGIDRSGILLSISFNKVMPIINRYSPIRFMSYFILSGLVLDKFLSDLHPVRSVHQCIYPAESLVMSTECKEAASSSK